jgi:predicted nucleic-acid-binding Zn-ribbon protein
MAYTREGGMEWLNKNWDTPKTCPICKHNNWSVSKSLSLLPRRVIDAMESPNLVFPVFLVTCGTCGYTMFFNALVAGFMPPSSEEKKEN